LIEVDCFDRFLEANYVIIATVMRSYYGRRHRRKLPKSTTVKERA
jgi:hypothetical protein